MRSILLVTIAALALAGCQEARVLGQVAIQAARTTARTCHVDGGQWVNHKCVFPGQR